MLHAVGTPLGGTVLLEADVFGDERGFFLETYRKSWLADMGIHDDFVQHNHSSSALHVLRGLHYQTSRPQAKLIRVVAGRIWDVVVDIRKDSADFGRWFGVELSGSNRRMLYVPQGFAHGFLALEEATEILYLCSDYYAPDSEAGIRWDCPALAVDWPLPQGRSPILSAKDRALPCFRDAILP